ncbi:MAG: general secretion pathway protein GspB [Thiohalocapsa sp.]|jgi:general secretion pathway protein B
MSYILEALKKSQSDRELGQIPRVEGFGIDVPLEAPASHPWAYLVLLLALAVAGAAAFLVLRGLADAPAEESAGETTALAIPPPEPVESRQHPPPLEMAATASAPAVTDPAAPEAPRSARPGFSDPAATPQPPPEIAARRPPDSDEPLEGPESLSIEPQVLVVPAPSKPGEPLPRGAEELRQAVLGEGGGRLSASVDTDNAAERDDLPVPPAPDTALPAERAPSEQTPVPEDVVAEIEAFKELVRKRDPDALKRPDSAPPLLPEPPGLKRLRPDAQADALPPRPSLDLRNRLPPFSMNVHVYNNDPQQRFVYINGHKLGEGQKSREGIHLEQVVADGAVLSYDGERFFQQR